MERDGSVSLQTFRSLFPGASGMFFESKHDQFIISLHNGYLHSPSNGWLDRVYYPIYDDFRDKVDHDYDDDDKDEHDDEYYDDEYYANYDDYDGHDKQCDTKPEDFSEVYSRMLREKHEEELYGKDDYDEDDYDD